MHRIMYDTNDPIHLPVSCGLLATYADLLDAAALEHLTGIHGQVIAIDRGLGDPAHLATVLDVEQHAQGATGAPAWYDAQHARGRKYLTVYCDRSTLPAVQAEMGPRSYYHWIARLDGIATVPGFAAGQAPAAVQILGAAALGFHADMSLVLQGGWNPAPAAASPAATRGALATAAAAIHDVQVQLGLAK